MKTFSNMEPETALPSKDAKAVISELQQYSICPRCILRVIGVKTHLAYRQPEKSIDAILSLKNKESTAQLEKEDTCTQDTLDKNKGIESEKKKTQGESSNNQTALTDDILPESADKTQEVGDKQPQEKTDDVMLDDKGCVSDPNKGSIQDDQGVVSDLNDRPICGLCLGILQNLCNEDCAKRIADQIAERGYQFCNFMMAVTLPLQLLIRENNLLINMSDKIKSFNDISSIKEVYKWIAGPMFGEALHVYFHHKSPFEVMVTMKHEESEREIELLLEKHGVTSAFPQQKKQRGPPRKKKMKVYHAADVAPTRQKVLKAINEMSHSLFKELFTFPPKCPSLPCSIEVMCSHGPIYIAGRYMKYSRKLSQSPWVVDGQRKTESSVQELICEYAKEKLQAEDYKFSSSGREDVDVRTLGRGRPFVVEFLNPRIPSLSQEELKAITQIVNSSTKEVKIRDLQVIAREDTASLKDGEEEKTKSYSALIWVEKKIQEEDLKFLSELKELALHQKTPIRVLHRRPLATRVRVVHSMTYEYIDSHHFKLYLNTQAGTYIKEFVHGDFGRTQPNLGTLMKTDADIVELDVEAVNVDWPPTVDD